MISKYFLLTEAFGLKYFAHVLLKEVKLRCQAMLQEALSQVEKRFLISANMCEGLSSLSPTKIVSHTLRGKSEDLPFPHHMECNSLVETQYGKVYLVVVSSPH